MQWVPMGYQQVTPKGYPWDTEGYPLSAVVQHALPLRLPNAREAPLSDTRPVTCKSSRSTRDVLEKGAWGRVTKAHCPGKKLRLGEGKGVGGVWLAEARTRTGNALSIAQRISQYQRRRRRKRRSRGLDQVTWPIREEGTAGAAGRGSECQQSGISPAELVLIHRQSVALVNMPSGLHGCQHTWKILHLNTMGGWVGGGGTNLHRPHPRDALEGKGPQRRSRRRLPKRLGGGYCRLRMPLRLALGVRGTGGIGWAPWRGGVPPPLQCIPAPTPPPTHTHLTEPTPMLPPHNVSKPSAQQTAQLEAPTWGSPARSLFQTLCLGAQSRAPLPSFGPPISCHREWGPAGCCTPLPPCG